MDKRLKKAIKRIEKLTSKIEKTDSDFGKGLTYCLGLFLAHAERYSRDGENESIKDILKNSWPRLWFNAASDHLYELVIPGALPEELKTRLATLQSKALHWGGGFGTPEATPKNVEWAIQEAKDLLRAIDQHWEVETIKGTWE